MSFACYTFYFFYNIFKCTFYFRGTLFKPEEALKIGLVDELASDNNDLLAKAEKYITGFAKIPSKFQNYKSSPNAELLFY